ncbi:uncharacterized protein MONBRDRAFT_22190 [Monosiga brevicollis MX1]|uniref:SAC3/GANP/THP3 conserved domain-containing protein n=1 Tax=Monosiga brevicollis TaxID=81824 RepID=A9UPU2_MONBE|nr:uncharacterized protein MONBRDRAFT_22190 [Monosiga brevicollis MX1]EDQ92480.1 predicted protein [Monosiga brevicollis MX1]|eukprot:XP_001742242.1 hypothetical protein [Monosiga brevicollis MX1]
MAAGNKKNDLEAQLKSLQRELQADRRQQAAAKRADSHAPVCGRCTTMCPAEEMLRRQLQHRLHPLEVCPSHKGREPRADPARTVKEYSRPAAAHDRLNDRRAFTAAYPFLVDRFRAVRQDLMIQRLLLSDAIPILEINIRVLLAASVLYCYTLLLPLYTRRREKLGLPDVTPLSPRKVVAAPHANSPALMAEAFHQAAWILLAHDQPVAINKALLLHASVRQQPFFQSARQLLRAWSLHNYVAASRVLKTLHPLLQGAAMSGVEQLRLHTIGILAHAYGSPNVKLPVATIAEWLCHSPGETLTAMLEAHGFTSEMHGSVFTIRKQNYKDEVTQVPAPDHATLERLATTCAHMDGVRTVTGVVGKRLNLIEVDPKPLAPWEKNRDKASPSDNETILQDSWGYLCRITPVQQCWTAAQQLVQAFCCGSDAIKETRRRLLLQFAQTSFKSAPSMTTDEIRTLAILVTALYLWARNPAGDRIGALHKPIFDLLFLLRGRTGAVPRSQQLPLPEWHSFLATGPGLAAWQKLQQ